MAIDLFCHSSLPLPEVREIISKLIVRNNELFASKFLISRVTESNDFDKELAYEHGLRAQCLFLVRVNDKSALGLVPSVVEIIKNVLGKSNVVVLFENEGRC